MAFIQAPQSVVSHRKIRKTLRLARLLNLDCYAVVVRLVELWSWCLDNAPDGVLGDDIDAEMLAEVMGWSADLGHSAKLLEALITAGFLELDAAGQRLRLVGWEDVLADTALANDGSDDEGNQEEG